MAGRQRSPYQAPFIPPPASNLYQGIEVKCAGTPSRSQYSNRVPTSHGFSPIEISLVVRYRNRYGQQLCKQKQVTLSQEDLERFEMNPIDREKVTTDCDARSLFQPTESNVSQSQPEYLHGEPYNQRKPTEAPKKPTQPESDSAFKRIIGANYTVSNYSPVDAPIKPQQTYHWPGLLATPNHGLLNAGIPQSTSSGSFPLYYHSTYYPSPDRSPISRNQHSLTQPAKEELPNQYSLTDRLAIPNRVNHQTLATTPPILISYSNVPLAPQKQHTQVVGDTRITNTHAAAASSQLQNSGDTSPYKSTSDIKGIIRLRSKQTIPATEGQEHQASGARLRKRISGIKVVSGKGQIKRAEGEQVQSPVQPSLIPSELLPATPVSSQHIQVKKKPSVKDEYPGSAATKTFFGVAPTPIQDPSKAAERLSRAPQTPVEAINNQMFPCCGAEPRLPLINQQTCDLPSRQPSILVRKHAVEALQPQAEQCQRARQQQQPALPTAQQPLGQVLQQSGQMIGQPQPLSEGSNPSQIQDSVIVSERQAGQPLLDMIQTVPQRNPEKSEEHQMGVPVKCQTPRQSEPIAVDSFPIRGTSSVISASNSKHQGNGQKGRARSVSPAPRRPYRDLSGPFAYLIDCRDRPQGYHHQRCQLDIPQAALDAWNRS